MIVGEQYQIEVMTNNFEIINQTFEVVEIRDGIVISQIVIQLSE
jgi:hypothetical protein